MSFTEWGGPHIHCIQTLLIWKLFGSLVKNKVYRMSCLAENGYFIPICEFCNSQLNFYETNHCNLNLFKLFAFLNGTLQCRGERVSRSTLLIVSLAGSWIQKKKLLWQNLSKRPLFIAIFHQINLWKLKMMPFYPEHFSINTVNWTPQWGKKRKMRDRQMQIF